MYQCVKCQKQFKNKFDLTRHYDRKKPCDQTIIHKCDNCLKEFSTKLNLTNHQNRQKPCKKVDPIMENYELKLENERLKNKIVTNELIHKTKNRSGINLNDGEIIDEYDNIDAILDFFHEMPVIYLGLIDENLIKFGHSNNFRLRYDQHMRGFKTFKLLYVKECYNNKLTETKLKQFAEENNVLCTVGTNTEIIKLTPDISVKKIRFLIENEFDNNKLEIDMLNLKIEVLTKELELANLKLALNLT